MPLTALPRPSSASPISDMPTAIGAINSAIVSLVVRGFFAEISVFVAVRFAIGINNSVIASIIGLIISDSKVVGIATIASIIGAIISDIAFNIGEKSSLNPCLSCSMSSSNFFKKSTIGVSRFTPPSVT